MTLFNKYPSAIYIRKKSLEFFVGENRKSLEFPEDTISSTDIVSPTKYEELIEEFITRNNLQKQKVLLILSEEVLFDKTFPSEDLKILDGKINEFLNMIPIEPEKIAKKTIESDKGIYFFAVNKSLFETLVEILERLEIEVLAVVPLTTFSTENILNIDIIKKIFDDRSLLNEANLLSVNPNFDNYSSVKKILSFLVFLILIGGVLVYLLKNDYLKFSVPFLSENSNSVKETTQPIPTTVNTTVTPSVASPSGILSRDQLKALVLNGTGIAGQAAKIKNILLELGLSKVETGNVEGPSVQVTTIAFSEKVATDLQEQIISLLENNFVSVSAENKISSPSADIVITTGKSKTTP